jgi:hypothetical protein
MLATATRPHTTRGQMENARTPDTAELPARRSAPQEAAGGRVAPSPRRTGFLTILMRALSAFNV